MKSKLLVLSVLCALPLAPSFAEDVRSTTQAQGLGGCIACMEEAMKKATRDVSPLPYDVQIETKTLAQRINESGELKSEAQKQREQLKKQQEALRNGPTSPEQEGVVIDLELDQKILARLQA